MDRLPASYLLVTTDYYCLLTIKPGKSRTGQVTTTSKLLNKSPPRTGDV